MSWYCPHDMLELFENEPECIYEDDEIEDPLHLFTQYSKHDIAGFKLRIFLVEYENKCILSLSHDLYRLSIIDMNLNYVDKIECTKEFLILRRSGDEKDIKVWFKPNFIIEVLDL